MTSKLKCPKCGGRLVYWGATGALLKCSQCGFGWGNEELWQELIRAKQDLVILTDSESRQITYMADGRTKVYYGRNGTQVETNLPLPVGFVITIKETTNDK